MCGVVGMALMGGAAAGLKRGDGLLAWAMFIGTYSHRSCVIVLYVGSQ